MSTFVHLHTHSHYTLLESPVTVPALVAAVKDKGMDAVALTDRNSLFGALEFQEAARAAGIKPIIGCQVNIAPLGIQEKTRDRLQLVLLAENRSGYFNLCRLVSRGWTEGFYYEPRVDLDLLAAHHDGVICLTGSGPNGFLNRHLEAGAIEEAERQLGLLRAMYGERCFVQIAHHDCEGDDRMREMAWELAQRCGVEAVATNWVHYLERADAGVHDVQLAVKDVTTLADTRRKHMPSEDFYLKTPEEMAARFADYSRAVDNARIIADRCESGIIPTGIYHLPVFTCPESTDVEGYRAGLDADEYRHRYEIDVKGEPKQLAGMELERTIRSDAYLAELCHAGLRERYHEPSDEAIERLEFELATIARMGFSAYFLIVSDFINWAKDHDIPVGPGRGSAAGSIVAYSLGITNICPLRYGLLFERFLNPGRISMPDIDIDFCKDRRDEVIRYVSEKYGEDAVTHIMTLGTMKARMAIKDVARAFEWTPEDSQGLANLVIEDPSGKHTIPVCLGLKPMKGGEYDKSDGMVARYERDDRARKVLDMAMRLENLGRNLGVHACGIIIAPGPVSGYVPVCTVKGKAATQYNMVQCEDCGLLKMDFLGLRTLSILKKAVDIVKATSGINIDYDSVPLDDAKTFRLLGEGRTLGVFQCESPGFQKLIKRLKPDRFEDMIALVALYRPGPLGADMHVTYCDRKHGLEDVEYPHPVLEDILSETFGLFIYQEQIMNISRELCGFSQSEADNLRKAMGKKKRDVLDKMKPQFVDGAWERHEFPKEKAEKMWSEIEGFASYCFNKSHSACYGLIAYWTAYMKANHYPEFMTANLIYEMSNKDKMTLFTQELAAMGISVLPPDVNESGWEFTWTGSVVRFGFGGVKGVGQKAAEAIIAEREANGPFEDLYEFCDRVDTRAVNKRVIESLIKVGALDSMYANRQALYESMDKALTYAQRQAKNREQSQTTLFDTFEQDDDFREQVRGYAETDDWDESERLHFEKHLTGYWLSGHPITPHRNFFQRFVTHRSVDLADYPAGTVTVAAVVNGKREMKTRTGKYMCVLQLEDEHGRFEAVLFSGGRDRRGRPTTGAYERFAHECEENLVALFTGKVDQRRKEQQAAPRAAAVDDEDPEAAMAAEEQNPQQQLPGILIDDIVPVHLVYERLTQSVEVLLDADAEDIDQALEQTERLMREYQGNCPVQALVHTPDEVLLTMQLGERWRIHPSEEALRSLEDIWGAQRVRPHIAIPT